MNDVPSASAADAPPWDDAPPPYGEPASPPQRKESSPAGPAPVKPAPAPAASGDLWGELVEQYKNPLMPMYWSILNDARGILEGDVMVVHCGDDFTMETLDCPAVTQAIQDVTGAKLGRPISVRFVVGGMDQLPKVDKLDELIRTGQKYPEFKVK